MNQPHDGTQREHSESSILGPAVPPPPGRTPSPEPLPEPLAPFLGGLYEFGADQEEPKEQEETGSAPVAGPASDADLPWLVDEPRPAVGAGEAPSYMGGVPEVSLGDDDDGIISIDALRPDPVAPEASAPETASAPEPPRAAQPQQPPQAQPPQGPERPEQEPPRDLHVEQAGGFVDAGAAIIEEVASRLEQIARTLRTRTPADLLSGSADPLEILVAGYVIGSSQARRGGDEGGPGL